MALLHRRNDAFIIFDPFSVSGCFRCLNNEYTNLLFDPCLVCILGRSLWRKVRRWGRVGWRTLTKKPTLLNLIDARRIQVMDTKVLRCWVFCQKVVRLPLWHFRLGGVFSYDLYHWLGPQRRLRTSIFTPGRSFPRDLGWRFSLKTCHV